MKFILKLIILQILAIVQPSIIKALQEWVSTHYLFYPMLIYQICIYIVFGLIVSFLLGEWPHPHRGVRIFTFVMAIFNLFIVLYFAIALWSILAFSLILIGVYLFFGISQLRNRRQNK